MLVTIFVKDWLGCYAHAPKLENMMSQLKKEFEVSKSNANLYMELHISWDKNHELMYINQSNFLMQIFWRFGFVHYAPISTPTYPNVWLDDVQVLEEELSQTVSYYVAIGSLQFAHMGSRPNISYVVTLLQNSQLTHSMHIIWWRNVSLNSFMSPSWLDLVSCLQTWEQPFWRIC